MQEMIAYCGLVCSNCPTFQATLNDDDEARAKTAAYYSIKYGFSLKPEDINCDGCLSTTGRLIGYCHACNIRKCCISKGLPSCSVCSKQPCEHIEKFHAFSPEAKKCFQRLVIKNQNSKK
jgi:hypothetical protein